MGSLRPGSEAAPESAPEAGLGSAAPALRARELSYRYPSGRRGVVGIDLEVAPGEVVAFLGPNGSGKTTLLRLLATDLRAGSGRLEILGRVPGRRPADLRRRLGVAGDEPVHLEALSGRQNAIFFGRAAGVPRAEAESRADELLALLGLAPDARAPAGSYSYGMRRKLLLTQALVAGPELVLLDEPTVGLDPPSRGVLHDLLRQRVADGAAVVLATNDLPFVRRVAHRIAFLHEGRKVADAPPSELLAAVEGRTTLEIGLEGPPPREVDYPPGLGVRPRPGGLVVESPDGPGVLPDVCRALLDAGAALREVRVREPDLADVFRALTGDELREDPPGP